MAQMTALEAVNQGVYGFYLAERARELAAELDALTPPGCTKLDGMALAAWAGRAGVTLKLIANEFAAPLPEPKLPPATEPEPIPSPCCPGAVARFTGNAGDGAAWYTCEQCTKTHAYAGSALNG